MQPGDRHGERTHRIEGVRLTDAEFAEYRRLLSARPDRWSRPYLIVLTFFVLAIPQALVMRHVPNRNLQRLTVCLFALIAWFIVDRCILRNGRRETLVMMGLLDRDAEDRRRGGRVAGVRLTHGQLEEFTERVRAHPARWWRYALIALAGGAVAMSAQALSHAPWVAPHIVTRGARLLYFGIFSGVGAAIVTCVIMRPLYNRVLREMGLIDREHDDWRSRFDES